jgi:hypothetical protein
MCNKGLRVSLKRGCPEAVYKGSAKFFRFPGGGKEKLAEILRQRAAREKNGKIQQEKA